MITLDGLRDTKPLGLEQARGIRLTSRKAADALHRLNPLVRNVNSVLVSYSHKFVSGSYGHQRY